jgi:hypothetical protein
MKTLLVSLIITTTALGSVVGDYPPITRETLVGVWERLQGDNPSTLWRMEINKTGESYLAQITIGMPCVVRHLTFSEIKQGKIRLHFEALPGDHSPDVWITGYGEATEGRGVIDWQSETGLGYFLKGSWTRDVADASRKAEESIRTISAK